MKIKTLLPILFGFFIMGFCDVVGISSSYIKHDFNLTDTQANFIPSMLFIWFLIISVPAGLLMNHIGRKKTVLLSMAITSIALFIPFIEYSYYSTLIAFALLGIGNTIIQVSLNPLLTNVVPLNKLTSALTAGQFVKAVSSFCGPIVAAFAMLQFGNWKMMFPIFALITIIAMGWLGLTTVKTENESTSTTTLGETLRLLSNRGILLLFAGIICIVGVDVGMNTMIPRLIMERSDIELSQAGYGTSLYFAFRTLGTFIGTFLLARFQPIRFYRSSALVAMCALLTLYLPISGIALLILIAIIGFAIANIFSIIFGYALEKHPDKTNPLSSLMIMGVSGGAIVPPLMGSLSEIMNGQSGSISVIAICMGYLLAQSFLLKKSPKTT